MYRHGASQVAKHKKVGFGNFMLGYAVFLLDYKTKGWMVGMNANL